MDRPTTKFVRIRHSGGTTIGQLIQDGCQKSLIATRTGSPHGEPTIQQEWYPNERIENFTNDPAKAGW